MRENMYFYQITVLSHWRYTAHFLRSMMMSFCSMMVVRSVGSMMMSFCSVISLLSRDMRAFPRCAIHAQRGRIGHLMWQSAWITRVEGFFSLGVPNVFKTTQQAECFCVQARSSAWSDRHLYYRRLHCISSGFFLLGCDFLPSSVPDQCARSIASVMGAEAKAPRKKRTVAWIASHWQESVRR